MITSDTLHAIEEEVKPLLLRSGFSFAAEKYLKAAAGLRIKILKAEADKAIEQAKKTPPTPEATNANGP